MLDKETSGFFKFFLIAASEFDNLVCVFLAVELPDDEASDVPADVFVVVLALFDESTRLSSTDMESGVGRKIVGKVAKGARP